MFGKPQVHPCFLSMPMYKWTAGSTGFNAQSAIEHFWCEESQSALQVHCVGLSPKPTPFVCTTIWKTRGTVAKELLEIGWEVLPLRNFPECKWGYSITGYDGHSTVLSWYTCMYTQWHTSYCRAKYIIRRWFECRFTVYPKVVTSYWWWWLGLGGASVELTDAASN